MAASDYKHPGWLLSISVCILQCGLREDWDGEGCCQTVTGDRDTSFLSFYFPCPPRCPLSSAPWLPDYNSSVLAKQPGWFFYRQPRHWGCQDNERKALQARSSVRQAQHIVHHESESSQYDPIPPLSIVDQCWKSRTQLFMMLWLRFLSVLDCCAVVQGWTEISYWSIQVFIAKFASNTVSLLHH